ncbi:hypothetical protein BJ878DRAFT_414145 [Calycina marina]|uniref:Maintenance of telomere capping protein 6 n=1 Tax=Calycina marina TaxID=1763456 RepID=A0A9P7Z994_9HELO|nr:hypothetical protein BJ878DRAFT_414145 [Calycina marina]
MSENYTPANDAIPGLLSMVRAMSQRDLGNTVPINKVTVPGVSVATACFSRLRYDNDDVALCISNLLAVGFRRLEVDLYWDELRDAWQFCPASVAESTISSVSPYSSFNTIQTLTSGESVTTRTTTGNVARQASTSTDLETTSSAAISSATLSSNPNSGEFSPGKASPIDYALLDDTGSSQLTIGLYTCSRNMGLYTLTSLLLDYIQQTETSTDASLLYLIVNIHATASISSPVPTPISLPKNSNLLSSQFLANLSSYLYTPAILRSNRANLNDSWLRVNELYRPLDYYYRIVKSQYGIISTQDGWPSEGYVELSHNRRLLLGFGTVDPQMEDYDFDADGDTIFPGGYIQNNQANVVLDGSGRLTSGCFILPTGSTSPQGNSSWAYISDLTSFPQPASLNSDISTLLNTALNATRCGISPILNTTLLGASATTNYIPYQAFTNATIWSWAPNEPQNFTIGAADSSSLFRCAVATLPLNGAWSVIDCSTKNFAACRAQTQPYNWTISSRSVTYTYASVTCPNGYVFAVPRSALENSYLTQAMMANGKLASGRYGAWVDFNSLDYLNCWVTGGPNVTCPYKSSTSFADSIELKQILVPTVAAIIVLIITALTVFAKATGTKSKRRIKNLKRANGFIYEGVPS